MKKILLFLLSFIFISPSFWSFGGTFTEITSGDTFIKNPGIHELRVYEDYEINIFSSNTITEDITTCTGNGCTCGVAPCNIYNGFDINGVRFTTSHLKHINAGEVRRDWYSYWDGIESRVEYLENTYTTENGNPKPNQSVLVRRYYIVTYKHDITPPTCGNINYFDDDTLTTPFSYTPWQWLIEPKYYTMTCEDSQTWCFCGISDTSCQMNAGNVISTPQLLGHKIKPSVNFTNSVRLSDPNCEPWGTFPDILYDLKTPQIDISLWSDSFELNQESLRVYDSSAWKLLDGIETYGTVSFSRSGSVNKIAWDTRLTLEVEDSFLTWSVHGVSGLKDYDFSISRLTDRSFDSITPQDISSCARNDIFTTPYNPVWNIEVSDSYSFDFDCNELLVAGEYEFNFVLNDWAWNKLLAKATLNIFPGPISQSDSILTSFDNSNKFANNVDTYDYTISLKDQYLNPIFNRNIDSIAQSIVGYTGGNEILLPNNSTGLRYDLPSIMETNKDGDISFSIRSLQPWTFTERFLVSHEAWNEDYLYNGITTQEYITNASTNSFLIPFSWALSLTDGTDPEVGTEQSYLIDLNNIWWVTWYSNSNLGLISNAVSFPNGHILDVFTSTDNSFSSSDLVCSFDALINSWDSSSVLEAPVMNLDNLRINYTLWGQNVSYILDSFWVSWCATSTIWAKVEWITQSDGKSNLTWNDGNFSDLYETALRAQIEKSASILISGMQSWEVINGVRYVEWDVTISGNQSYETLIVKNGNVFISWDVNTSGDVLWIIVLRDSGYNLNTDYNNTWNIYVANTVGNINANIYAAWTFRSANASGGKYLDDDLWAKLHLNGSLFTRNTIWWGIDAGADFILPWWGTTPDIDLARVYDLNYIRRAQSCWVVDDYSFLIKYDPRIQINPPKWFENL